MNIRDLFNLNTSEKTQILCIALVAFIMCTQAVKCTQGKEDAQTQPEQNKTISTADSVNRMYTTQIERQDSAIANLFWEIDSIVANKTLNTTDSLLRNPDYIAHADIAQQLDSLGRENRKQLRRAQRAAAESPSYIKNIPCSEETFYKFFHVPAVRRAQCAYDQNNRTIERLRNTQQSLPTPQTTEDNIRQYFDSITNVQIAQRLKQIDLLLGIKDSIISEKQR